MSTSPNRMTLKAMAMMGVATSVFIATASYAQASNTAIAFDIDAQPLGQALTEFGIQSGTEVFFVGSELVGKTSADVEGEYPPREAATLLLADAGIDYRFDVGGALLVGAANIEPQQDAAIATGQGASLGEETPSPFRLAQVQREGQNPIETESVFDQAIEEGFEDVIVVTGTNIRGVSSTASPVLTIDRIDIEAGGFGTTSQLLETLPSNFAATGSDSSLNATATNNGFANSSGVDLRGLGQGSTLVLLNGRRLPLTAAGSLVDVNTIPIGLIDRVEVIGDGASAIYGTDAVGGVVNFLVRNDFEGIESVARYDALGGSGDSWRFDQTAGAAWSSGNILGSISYSESDNLEASDRDFVPDESEIEDLSPERDLFSAYLFAKQQLNDRLTASIDALCTSNDVKQGGNLFFDGFENKNETILIGSRLDVDIGSDFLLNISPYYAESSNDALRIGLGGAPNAEFDRTYKIESLDVLVEGPVIKMPSGNIRVAIGGSYRNETFEDFAVGSVSSGAFERETAAIFSEAYIPLISENNQAALAKSLDAILAVRYEDVSDFGSTTNPKFGLVWGVSDTITLRGTYSTSFKAPDLRELTTSFNAAAAFPGGNFGRPADVLVFLGFDPDLDPQESENLTIGGSFEPKWQNNFSVSLNYFDIEYSNIIDAPGSDILIVNNPDEFGGLITEDPGLAAVNEVISLGEAGQGFFNLFPVAGREFNPEEVTLLVDSSIQNLGALNVSGFDVSTNVDLPVARGQLSFNADATYLIDRESRVTETSEPLNALGTIYNPSELRVRAGLSYVLDAVSLNTFVNHVSGSIDNRGAVDVDIGSWTTVDFTAAYSFDNNDIGSTSFLTRGLKLSLSVQNLFDQDPPSVPLVENFDLGYDSTNANPLGRVISLQLRKSF